MLILAAGLSIPTPIIQAVIAGVIGLSGWAFHYLKGRLDSLEREQLSDMENRIDENEKRTEMLSVWAFGYDMDESDNGFAFAVEEQFAEIHARIDDLEETDAERHDEILDAVSKMGHKIDTEDVAGDGSERSSSWNS